MYITNEQSNDIMIDIEDTDIFNSAVLFELDNLTPNKYQLTSVTRLDLISKEIFGSDKGLDMGLISIATAKPDIENLTKSNAISYYDENMYTKLKLRLQVENS